MREIPKRYILEVNFHEADIFTSNAFLLGMEAQ